MKKKKSSRNEGKQRIIVTVLAVLMALLMLLPMLTMILPPAGAATSQSDIDALKEKSKALESQKSDINSQLTSLQGKQSEALSEKLLVEQQIDVIQTQISTSESLIAQYQAQVDDLNTQIEQKQVELTNAQQAEAERYQLFCDRVRSMEEDGATSYWDVIFNAKDFSDLLDRLTFINEVADYDNAVIDSLKEARQAVQDAKTQLESAKTEQEATLADQQAVQDQLVSQKSDLDDKEATIESLLTEIKNASTSYATQLDALDAKTDAIDAEILQKQAALEAQLASQQYQYDTGTGYCWPVAGHYYISSPFGKRVAPLAGATTFHNGVDIAAPYGTKIQAARGGVVITSSYNSSYGNYVVISHGNNDSTLYAHMSKRAVSEGDTVVQGAVIGYVGSTGSSTGNHLHFEIRVGGARENPVNYFPSLNFTY